MKDIIVIGDAILDCTTHVTVRGPSPEFAHILVVEEGHVSHNLGGAANVAAGIKALGSDPLLLAIRSADDDGQKLEHLLLDHGIRHHFSVAYGGHTTRKNRIVAPSGQILRVDRERAGAIMPGSDGLCGRLEVESQGDVVGCLVDYDKGVFALGNTHRVLCLLEGKPILVDPGRNGDWWRFGSPTALFKVNFAQAVIFYERHRHFINGLRDPRVTGFDPYLPARVDLCEEIGRRVRDNMRLLDVQHRYLVVTLGLSGLVLLGVQDMSYNFREEPVPLVDPCGAGDTVMAALTWAVARFGYEEPDIVVGCRLAVKAASLAVQRRGVTVVSASEVFNEPPTVCPLEPVPAPSLS